MAGQWPAWRTVCDHLLEDDVDAAARGVFERLFGLVAEAILLETVNEEQEK